MWTKAFSSSAVLLCVMLLATEAYADSVCPLVNPQKASQQQKIYLGDNPAEDGVSADTLKMSLTELLTHREFQKRQIVISGYRGQVEKAIFCQRLSSAGFVKVGFLEQSPRLYTLSSYETLSFVVAEHAPTVLYENERVKTFFESLGQDVNIQPIAAFFDEESSEAEATEPCANLLVDSSLAQQEDYTQKLADHINTTPCSIYLSPSARQLSAEFNRQAITNLKRHEPKGFRQCQ